MPVKIRLQRHGKKGKPFYWIVAADSRAPRDGKFLEKLGIYNPNTNPATIDLNIDKSVEWLQNGAQPTHTARAILSYKGVMMKKHLLGGVAKGALTPEQVEEKFNAWLESKASAVEAKKDKLSQDKAKAREAALAAEKEVNEKRAAKAVAATEEETATEEVVEETTTEEVAQETPAAEETAPVETPEAEGEENKEGEA
jgi:small subunit ribosomal protein S16